MSTAAPLDAVRPSPRLRPAAVVLVVVLAAAVGASAATLGGIAVDRLGAGSASGHSHPAGVDVRWTPDFGGGRWLVGDIEITARASGGFAVGERLHIALLPAAGAPHCELARTITAPTATIVVGAAELTAACGAIAFSGLDRVALAVGS